MKFVVHEGRMAHPAAGGYKTFPSFFTQISWRYGYAIQPRVRRGSRIVSENVFVPDGKVLDCDRGDRAWRVCGICCVQTLDIFGTCSQILMNFGPSCF